MLDAFISYSTHNMAFVQSLAASLSDMGKRVWFDQKRDPLEGLPGGTKWWDEITHGIQQAANLLFIISPQSIVSPFCTAELALARAQEKRIVTVLFCEGESVADTLERINRAMDAVDPDVLMPETVSAPQRDLRSLVRENWLYINQIQFIIARPADHIESLTAQIADAIDLDIQWLRLWNDFRQAVQLWDENQRDEAYLWPEGRLKPLREAALDHGQALDDVQFEFAVPEVERLLWELDDPDTTHSRRSEIGLRLHDIGDPRPGVGLDADGLPDLVWCAVPPGAITIAIPPLDTYTVRPFFITRYPITFAQFQTYLDAQDGFGESLWRRWFPPDEQQNFTMRSQHQPYANYPRDSVSWFQAVAFTRWLRCHLQGRTFSAANAPDQTFTVGEDWQIRLPVESEWQLAAAGGDADRDYPWGDRDDRLANTEEAKIGRTTAVGMYPQGAAPCGALDMAGGVQEWCLNDSIDLNATGASFLKELRGGSYAQMGFEATCAYRNAAPSLNATPWNGFRVVCGPPLDHEVGDPEYRQPRQS